MIRYPVSKDLLENLIETERPGWLQRAKERTETFRDLGHYKESSSIWSEIKPVFMRLQHCKCAYCERQLESAEYGRIEHDLEHFRPKKKAKPWRLTKSLKEEGVTVTPPLEGAADPGYHLLAYNPLNYCTSCKTCNSRLKRDYFPIEGDRSSQGSDPAEMASELPLLINPVGQFDHDPADLIRFHGLSPVACGDTPYKYRRSLVSIAFFHLDDRKRKYLFRERAENITQLYSFLKNAERADTDEEKSIWENLIKLKTSPAAPHTNCAESFCALYKTDKAEAKEIFLLASEYIKSISQ